MNIKVITYNYLKKIATYLACRNSIISSRIFIYHNVPKNSVDSFRDQMIIIKNNFDTIVTASEFVKLFKENKLQSKRYACITFDDGFEDIYLHAKPVLDELKIPATIFLNQNLFDYTNSNDIQLDKFISNSFPRLAKTQSNLNGLFSHQLHKFILDGYEIGGHTCTHTAVSKMSVKQFEDEIEHQRDFLKQIYNYEIVSFAYPYGRKKDIPLWGATSLKKFGYNQAFSGISSNLHKKNSINLYFFPRTCVSLEIDKQEFLAILYGSSDIIDRLTLQYL